MRPPQPKQIPNNPVASSAGRILRKRLAPIPPNTIINENGNHTERESNLPCRLTASVAGAVVAKVRKMSVAPLPAATCIVLNEQVVTGGQAEDVMVTGLGNTRAEGVTVMSYIPDEPAAIVAGPEFVIIKLKAPDPTFMVRITVAAAFCEFEVPVTMIE